MDLNKNGRLLCDLRKAKGLTQKQVADKLGIVPKTVSKWETAKGYPDISLLEPIAEVFGVSVTELLSGQAINNVNNTSKTIITESVVDIIFILSIYANICFVSVIVL